MATKSRFERNWHNTLHFVHWCRYGETPQEARMRQVNETLTLQQYIHLTNSRTFNNGTRLELRCVTAPVIQHCLFPLYLLTRILHRFVFLVLELFKFLISLKCMSRVTDREANLPLRTLSKSHERVSVHIVMADLRHSFTLYVLKNQYRKSIVPFGFVFVCLLLFHCELFYGGIENWAHDGDHPSSCCMGNRLTNINKIAKRRLLLQISLTTSKTPMIIIF